jgi:flagellar biogenesis protein FliO
MAGCLRYICIDTVCNCDRAYELQQIGYSFLILVGIIGLVIFLLWLWGRYGRV